MRRLVLNPMAAWPPLNDRYIGCGGRYIGCGGCCIGCGGCCIGDGGCCSGDGLGRHLS